MTYRVLLAIVAACLVSACHHDAAEDTATETPVVVQVEPVKSGPIREVIAACRRRDGGAWRRARRDGAGSGAHR